ncbi:MAG: DUF1080 domain-containing protein [Acidobacteria bacterium]|nr:DUF1080 domain-containing protein [Acidobacteriota bacterium]
MGSAAFQGRNTTRNGEFANTMLRICFLALIASLAVAADADFNGRWLLEPTSDGPGRVGWLEIEGAGRGAVTGSAVGLQQGGQVDPIAGAEVSGGELRFRVDRPRSKKDPTLTLSSTTVAKLSGGELHGTTTQKGKEMHWVGHRAPEIDDADDGSWRAGKPVILFDGRSLDSWSTLHPERNGEWIVVDGKLINNKGADELVSKQKFWNFRLHVEYAVMPHSNSGIGLRGRYEIQIYDDYGEEPSKSGNGALYSRKAADVNASMAANQRQTLDVTLIGRELTAVLNGQTIHDHVDVHGLTAMATDWHEDQPGPITLQGDHGSVEFYKIVVTPLERK